MQEEINKVLSLYEQMQIGRTDMSGPEFQRRTEELKKNLSDIAILEETTRALSQSGGPLLSYRLEDTMNSFSNGLTDVRHNLLGSYLSENLMGFPAFAWFVDEGEERPHHYRANKIKDNFVAKLVPLSIFSDEKKIFFVNKPSVAFYEILIEPRQVIGQDDIGLRYAGNARFDFDLDRNQKGKLMFYQNPILLPKKVEKLEHIPQGTFYIKHWANGEIKEAVCVENENYVKDKRGFTEKSSSRFSDQKMANYNFELRKRLSENPVVSRFRQMKYYLVEEGPDNIQETRSLPMSDVYLEKSKFVSQPKHEFTLQSFRDVVEKLGFKLASEPKPYFENAVKIDYKVL